MQVGDVIWDASFAATEEDSAAQDSRKEQKAVVLLMLSTVVYQASKYAIKLTVRRNRFKQPALEARMPSSSACESFWRAVFSGVRFGRRNTGCGSFCVL